MKLTKAGRKNRIHLRIRKKVSGTSERPRLAVYRSNKAIYCQLIDDVAGVTIASAYSSDAAVTAGPKIDQSKQVGKLLAERALAANVTRAVFDRGGYLYHGRVKSLADGAREGGLNL